MGLNWQLQGLAPVQSQELEYTVAGSYSLVTRGRQFSRQTTQNECAFPACFLLHADPSFDLTPWHSPALSWEFGESTAPGRVWMNRVKRGKKKARKA